jgi:hypothetical protein
MIYVEPICLRCKNYNMQTSTCRAFTDHIPDEIYQGSNKHSKPLPGQGNDIVFEPINDKNDNRRSDANI